MGRPAARNLHQHTCPLTEPAPHKGGVVTTKNNGTVFVKGVPAAVLFDPAPCDAGGPNLVMMGSWKVRIESFPAARKYDLTIHTGMILEGEPSVQIGGDTPAILLALAILRIHNSPYGQTPEGKAMVKKLSDKLHAGKISAQDLRALDNASGVYVDKETARLGKQEPGLRWMDEGDIAVEETQIEDVDRVAQTLVHEGKHAQLKEDEKSEGKDELKAFAEENDFYKTQREQGYRNPSSDEVDRAVKAGTLPDLLKKRGYKDKDL